MRAHKRDDESVLVGVEWRWRRRRRGVGGGLAGPVALMDIGVERRRHEPRLRALHTKMGSTLLGSEGGRKEGKKKKNEKKSQGTFSFPARGLIQRPRSVFITFLLVTNWWEFYENYFP